MQLGVMVDIYRLNGSCPYNMHDWFEFGATNPTSAFVSIKIDRAINTPLFSASLVLKPMKDAQGKTWADLIQLMDVVVVTVRQSIDREVVERIKFFGFVMDIIEDESWDIHMGKGNIVLQCQAYPFLTNPLLAFDNMSDPMAAGIGVKTRIWESLAPLEDKPSLSMGKIIDNGLYELLKPIKLDGNPIGDYLHYVFETCSNILPFTYTMAHSYITDAMMYDFWSALSKLAEIQGEAGWLHEMFLDIVDDEQMNNMSGDAVGPMVAIPGTARENFYLTLVCRENPFPTFTTGNAGLKDIDFISLPGGGVSYDSSRWDDLLVNTLRGNPIAFQSCKSANLLKTIFTIDMEVDPTRWWSWNLPTIVDVLGYTRIGYNSLNILTSYARCRSGLTSGSIIEKDETLLNIIQLNLRNASYNACMDLYKQATLVIPLDISVGLGELYFLPQDITGKKDQTYYINRISDIITTEGISSTTMTLTRGMYDSEHDSLETAISNRLAFARTVDIQKRLDNLPAPIKDGYLKGLAQ